MSATAVIVVEGVLRQQVGDGTIPSGIRLYSGLSQIMKVALISDDDEESVKRWLRLNGLKDHPQLVARAPMDHPDATVKRLKQLGVLRSFGCNIEFVVEPDPAVATVLLEHGFPVFAALHPQYSRPEFRPDFEGTVVPWDSLVAEVDRQREQRASDERPGTEI